MKYICLFVIFPFLFGCYGKPREKTGLEGKSIPSFKILLQDSVTYIDANEIKTNKPVVFFYYGPYCPYSRAQMEEMIENMGIMKNIQFVVVTRSAFQDMKRFSTDYNLSKYINIIEGVDYQNFLENYFKIVGVPFTAIYDRDKKLICAFTGKIFTKQIINAINP